MVDTNILVSAILLESAKINDFFKIVFAKHTLVLASYTIKELREVAEEKFPDKASVIDEVLERMTYESANTPQDIEPDLFEVRDPDDYPVLYTAINAGVDVLVTGDKDLLVVDVDSPEILKPGAFLEHYV
jgi:putative PIN family toxin of toxin-antitoxin system